jgi:sRNA-binding protein
MYPDQPAIRMMITSLCQRFPAVFVERVWEPHKALTIGTRDAIIALWPDVDGVALGVALRAYCGRIGYRRALLAPGAMRFNLQGEPIEPVSDDDRADAAKKLERQIARREQRVADAKAKAVANAANGQSPPEVQSEPRPDPTPVIPLEPRRASLADLRAASKLRKAG